MTIGKTTSLVALALAAGIGCAGNVQAPRHVTAERENPAECAIPVWGYNWIHRGDSWRYLICRDDADQLRAFIDPLESDEWSEVEYDPFFVPGGEAVMLGKPYNGRTRQ